ncbi:MAG: hypothetical protein AB7V13_17890 [Pseudorhodoplanes sp.]|uniref:hypothetical protein n=1 Tax=Pseudorhodoplanes sp. TaxID=1934341 RepID=UPI003D128859
MRPRHSNLIAALLVLVFGTLSDGVAGASMETPHGARGDENATNSGGAGAGEGMPTIEFQSDKPPLRLTKRDRNRVAEAISRERTYQRKPEGFEPHIGLTVRKEIKLSPMPRPLIYQVPALRQYDYAKLQSNILVIDPMSMTIVDVIPRKYPSVGQPISAMEWWSTRGRSLIGLTPEPARDPSAAREDGHPR